MKAEPSIARGAFAAMLLLATACGAGDPGAGASANLGAPGAAPSPAPAAGPSAALPQPATGVTLSADRASPQPQGTAVTFTASGLGSSGYAYQFTYQAATSPTASLAQDWSSAATWTMPAALAAGDYTVVVLVRTGTAGFDALASMTFTLAGPVAQPPPTPPPPTQPPPSIAAVTPRFGPVAGGTTVVVTGSGFQEGLTVFFGAFPQGVVSVTPTAVTLVTTKGIIGGCARCTGLVDVVVLNPDGKEVVLGGGFTYF